MIVVLFLMALIGAACLGSGAFLAWVFERTGLKGEPAMPVLFAFGIFLLTLVSTVLCLFLPINAAVQVCVLLAAFLSSWVFRRMIGRAWEKERKIWTRGGLAALCIGLLLAALLGTGPHFYDTGLYHAQSIKWVREYGTVLGLGNIHSRFAFNSVLWPLAGLFSGAAKGPFPVVPAAAGLLMYTALRSRILGRFTVLILVPVILFLFYYRLHLSSPSADCFAAACLLSALYLELSRKGEDVGMLRSGSILLLVMAVLTKPSALPAAIVLVPAFLADRRPAFWIWPVALGMALLARDVMLSGYVLFPAVDLSLPVDWKIPSAERIIVKDSIVAWARMPGVASAVVLAFPLQEWVPRWFQSQAGITRIILIVAPITSCIAAVVLLYKGLGTPAARKELLESTQLIWIGGGLIGAAVWFFSAPDPRFGIIYMLVLLTSALSTLPAVPEDRARFASGVTAGMLGFVFLFASGAYVYLLRPRILLNPMRLPDAPVEEARGAPFRTWIPVKTDQCYTAPLPCVPNVNPAAVLRGADLSQGFRQKQ